MVKTKAMNIGEVADHRPVQISNTMSKVGDKAVLEQCQTKYVKEMIPQHVGVGVKFAAELRAMGLRMVLHLNTDFIINAYNEIKRAAILGAHKRHTHFHK